MRQAGVYAILNISTGRRYIGSSVHIAGRWSDHLSRLKRGNHHCSDFQKDWTFFGPEGFGWQILEVVEDRSELIAAEQRWLNQTPTAYNASRRAGGGPKEGFRHTAESIAKMSAVAGRHRKGAKLSPAHVEALRKANTGREKSTEERAKLKLAHIGRVFSATHRDHIRLSKLGVALSPKGKESYDLSRVARGAAVSRGKKGVPWSVDRWHAYALRYKA